MKSRLGLAVIALLLATGCLNGDKSVSICYDPGKDQFSFLIVYQRIRIGRPFALAFVKAGQNGKHDNGDLPDLLALYANRDHLILWPGPPPMDFSVFDTAILRISNHTGSSVDLGTVSQNKACETSLPLDQIQILPGDFFLRGPGNLCYYHEIVLSGSVLDSALSELNKWLNQAASAEIATELNAALDRRRNGEQRIGWSQFTSDAVETAAFQMDWATHTHSPVQSSIEETPPGQPTTEPAQTQPTPQSQIVDLRALESASIRALLGQVNHGSLKIQRQGSRLFLRVDMKQQDVEGAVAFFATYRKFVETEAATKLAKEPSNAAHLEIWNALNAVDFTPAGKTTLEISCDIVRFLNCYPHPTDAPVGDVMGECQDLANEVEKSTGVNKSETVEQIERDFESDKLAAHPPRESVQPGTGLPPVSAQ